MGRGRVDVFAAIAAVIAIVMIGVYVGVMHQQDDQPAAWVVAVLIVGAAAAAYGAVTSMPYRRPALFAAAFLLLALGLLAILTIGLPILLAGALCLGSALRGGLASTHGRQA
jgi:uncharacterized membrane protein YccC